MSKILLAWELGADYGHISTLLPIARRLRADGHEIFWVLRDLSQSGALLCDEDGQQLQAPLWLPPVKGLPPARSYPEMLWRFGWLSADNLLGIVRAWRGLFELIKPELLIVDHAPNALLASRGLAMKRLRVGNGFSNPPLVQPLLPFHWWEAGAGAHSRRTESDLLRVANRVLASLKAPELPRFSSLLETDASFLTCFPELDHYPRENGDYIGPIGHIGNTRRVNFPSGQGATVFAYLKTRYEQLDALLDTLRSLDNRTLVHAPGISQERIRRLQSARLAFATKPVDIAHIKHQSTVAVTHGGNLTGMMLAAGVPVLVLPMQVEQVMTARKATETAAAEAVFLNKPSPDFSKPLVRLLEQAGYKQRAQAFSERVKHLHPIDAVERIAATCQSLLQAR